MIHPIHRVMSVQIIGEYRLRLSFEDNTTQDIDFRPILRGKLFGPLRDLDYFNQVKVDPEAHTIVWPNGADFDPAMLHNWPQCEAAMIDLASSWKS